MNTPRERESPRFHPPRALARPSTPAPPHSLLFSRPNRFAGVDDLILLPHLHEPRSSRRCPCARAPTPSCARGPILLALNPFRPLPGVCADATLRAYAANGAARGASPAWQPAALLPPTFAVADAGDRACAARCATGPRAPRRARPRAAAAAAARRRRERRRRGGRGVRRPSIRGGESVAGKAVAAKIIPDTRVNPRAPAAAAAAAGSAAAATRAAAAAGSADEPRSPGGVGITTAAAAARLWGVQRKVLESNPLLRVTPHDAQRQLVALRSGRDTLLRAGRRARAAARRGHGRGRGRAAARAAAAVPARRGAIRTFAREGASRGQTPTSATTTSLRCSRGGGRGRARRRPRRRRRPAR